MTSSSEIFGSILILIATFFLLSLIRRWYQQNLSASTERLFFEDWDRFETNYRHNAERTQIYMRKKIQDVIQRFAFYRWICFTLLLIALTLVIMPIEWITDFFQIGLNTAFSIVIIYSGYLVWKFTGVIRSLKVSKSNIDYAETIQSLN